MGVNSRRGSNINVGMNYQGVVTGVQQIEAHMGKLTKSVNRIGGAFSAIFAVDMLRGIGSSVVSFAELGGQIDGVTAAFNRIADANTLQKLNEETNGLINNFELMKLAVQAKNFNIPLTELGGLLAFAQQRARETGQSVEYMAQSIITGLGRESVLILDNLGLSAARIRKEMEQGGTMAEAVGRIIKQDMAEAGQTVLTTADKIQQMRVRFQNLQNFLAGAFVKTLMTVGTLFSHVADIFVGTFKILSNVAQNAFGGLFKYLYEMGVTMSTMFGPAGAFGRTLVQTFAGFADYQKKILTDLPKLRTWGQVWEDVSMIWTKGVASGTQSPSLLPDPTPTEEAAKRIEHSFEKIIIKAKEFTSVIPQTINAAAEPITQAFSQLGSQIRDSLEVYIEQVAFDVFTRLGEGLFGAARDVEDWGNKMIASFGGFLQQMGGMIFAYGFSMKKFRGAFSDPIGAMIAGAALIAIGGGIKALHENKMNGGAGTASVPVQNMDSGYNFYGRVDGYDLVLVTDRNQRLMNRRG